MTCNFDSFQRVGFVPFLSPICPRTSGTKKQLYKLLILKGFLVGARGFEPPTPTTPLWCATRLRYAPTCL